MISRIFLYGNNISKMENISHLKELETLWLARNNIINIEVAIEWELEMLCFGLNLEEYNDKVQCNVLVLVFLKICRDF